jgi:hypothetical protein
MLDITFQLKAPPGRKPPGAMPLTIECAYSRWWQGGHILVSPDPVSVARGVTQQFYAASSATGAVDISRWKVEGNDSSGTGIDGNGLLTVATDETAQTLTVTAEAGGFFSGTAAVTVIDGQVSVTSGQGESPIVERGHTEQFTATSVAGGPLMWSVTGSGGASAIADNGLLTVGEGETAMMLSVTAALAGNPQVRGTAVVRLPTVTAVTVFPGGGELAPGEGGQFIALVEGFCLDDPDGIENKKGVMWEMEGNASSGTYIEEDGRFHVAWDETVDETEAKLTVKAVSKYDSAKFGTATVKVIDRQLNLTGVSANGTSGKETTTELRLMFNRDIADLTAVTVTLSGCGAQMAGTLTKVETETGIYTLGVSSINEEGDVTVEVKVNDSPPSLFATVRVYYVKPVSFNSVTANGTAGSATTTQLTLVFSEAIAGLTENDITLTPASGNSGLAKGTLSGNGSGYTLPVSGISAAGSVTVLVGKSGYNINPSSISVTVYAVPPPQPVSFTSVTANGAAGSTATTELTLNFDRLIDALSMADITLTPLGGVNSGLKKVGFRLHEPGPPATYILSVSGISAAGSVTVSVGKSGFGISGSPKTVRVHYRTSPASIKERLGLPMDTGVMTVFYALHSFIQGGGLSTGKIQLGDWIDLDSLSVAGPVWQGGFEVTNTDITPTSPPFTGYEGKLLRLIVVGINSFQSGRGMTTGGTETVNGDTNGLYQPPSGATVPSHVVFQFQNIPGSRPMNISSTNVGGYAASEMRTYLVPVEGAGGNFLTGLTNAGVPASVLWAPTRYVANGGNGATGADSIEDLLWLPTEREMFGTRSYSNEEYETETNQARLEYYDNNSKQRKFPSNTSNNYWQASPYPGGTTSFCLVSYDGSVSYTTASSSFGVAPAFCVK